MQQTISKGPPIECHRKWSTEANHATGTVFPRLDALHVLDASARFDAEWSGRNTF